MKDWWFDDDIRDFLLISKIGVVSEKHSGQKWSRDKGEHYNRWMADVMLT